VKIRIDKNYVVAAGGYLQNPQEIGYGYEAAKAPRFNAHPATNSPGISKPQCTRFRVGRRSGLYPTKITADDGTIMRFFWQKGKGYDAQWEAIAGHYEPRPHHHERTFRQIPLPESIASFRAATAAWNTRWPRSSPATAASTASSAWLCTSNCTPGTKWYSAPTKACTPGWTKGSPPTPKPLWKMNWLAKDCWAAGKRKTIPLPATTAAYTTLATSGKEEPLTTHADHFKTNYAYSMAAYVKGCVFMRQLEYM
jgi:hypothetical protein